MHHMTSERGAVLIKRFQPLDREIAAFRQNSVQSRARVPLAHNEPITIRPIGTLWIVSKRSSVNGGEQVCRRQCAADVRSVGLAGHANAVLANSLCKSGEVGLLFVSHCVALFQAKLKRRETDRRSYGARRHRAAGRPELRPRPDDQM